MSTADQQIAEVLAKFGEPMAGNVWRVQGTAVIYHRALERIAAQARITFDPPIVLRAERDEAVILVAGRLGDRSEWSIGEALVNVNYRVSGRQAAYVYAMAEKRAKDRVILKLIELHGLVYSEEEADEFSSRRQPEESETPEAPPPPPFKVTSGPRPQPAVATFNSLLAAINSAKSHNLLDAVVNDDAHIDLFRRLDSTRQGQIQDAIAARREYLDTTAADDYRKEKGR